MTHKILAIQVQEKVMQHFVPSDEVNVHKKIKSKYMKNQGDAT